MVNGLIQWLLDAQVHIILSDFFETQHIETASNIMSNLVSKSTQITERINNECQLLKILC